MLRNETVYTRRGCGLRNETVYTGHGCGLLKRVPFASLHMAMGDSVTFLLTLLKGYNL